MYIKTMALLLLVSANVTADTLSWCAYYNWSPWIYKTQNNTYAGIMIDQLDMFRKTYPEITIESKIISNWKRCQAEVANGNVTMILGANKTPEREAIYDYMPKPSFINVSIIDVYTAKNNKKVINIKTIDDLRRHKLAMVRGNSYGSSVDPYIASLAESEIHEVSSRSQVMQLVSVERYDYFFMPSGQLEPSIVKNVAKFPDLKTSQFKKVIEVPRSTPTFFVFGKGNGNYQKYADKWLNVINNYHKSVNIEDEIKRHKKQSM